jgi:elongation factor Ts
MAEITSTLVKELRERTGIGMNDCKKALVEANGDIEEAITVLRKKGLASASKKDDRAANEGMIGAAATTSHIALVEINSETDFVVRNDRFQEFLKNISEELAKTTPASLEDFMKQKYSKDSAVTIEEYRATMVQTIGENIQIRRFQVLPKHAGSSYGIYSHLGGQIVTIVEITGDSDKEEVAKDVAMHVAATSPSYLSPENVPAEVLSAEKEIVKSQIVGKPENMIDKIVDGKLKAFYKENCLTEQPFIKDDSKSVREFVLESANGSNKELSLKSFVRWKVGQ